MRLKTTKIVDIHTFYKVFNEGFYHKKMRDLIFNEYDYRLSRQSTKITGKVSRQSTN